MFRRGTRIAGRGKKTPEQSAVLYRARQFFAAALGRVSTEEMAEAREALGPELYALFASLPGQYRHHMLRVYGRLVASGCDDPEVRRAALLHDAGKYDPGSGRYVSLPYRVAVVLLAAFSPGRALLRRLSSRGEVTERGSGLQGRALARQMGWRYPFYLNSHHPRLGAQLAERYGASQTVVRLVASHHAHDTGDHRLAALQAADEES